MENADNGCFMPIISSEKDSEIFFSKLSGTELLIAYLNNKGYTPSNKIFYYKNSLLDSGLLSIFFKDSSYNINLNLKSYLISDNTKYYNRIVFEIKYNLNEEDKQCLIELVLIKYNNNLSYSTKEENQFKKEGLTPLILKAFEHSHINVKHKHREKELEILFFESKQELYNSINKP
ncbi:hypothetical protein FNE31_03230 [Helicobacter pylori]|nr:hypothetical protein FNE31_03230 [Helicobacter pylori]